MRFPCFRNLFVDAPAVKGLGRRPFRCRVCHKRMHQTRIRPDIGGLVAKFEMRGGHDKKIRPTGHDCGKICLCRAVIQKPRVVRGGIRAGDRKVKRMSLQLPLGDVAEGAPLIALQFSAQQMHTFSVDPCQCLHNADGIADNRQTVGPAQFLGDKGRGRADIQETVI